LWALNCLKKQCKNIFKKVFATVVTSGIGKTNRRKKKTAAESHHHQKPKVKPTRRVIRFPHQYGVGNVSGLRPKSSAPCSRVHGPGHVIGLHFPLVSWY
jgi:hypothetical protein